VRPLNVKSVSVSPGVSAGVQIGADPPPSVGGLLEFVGYLARRHAITGDLLSKFSATNRPSRQKKLRDLWDLTELPAEEFTDEVARFYKLTRLNLPQLLSASSLAQQFSQRFLREMAVFPCRLEGEKNSTIVLADPTDTASVRAVELTLGEPIALPLHHLTISRPHWLNVSGRKGRRHHRVAKQPQQSSMTTLTACATLPAEPRWCVRSTI